jgi:hypothetical protein
VQRCHGAPSTLAIAFFSPSWASSCTPTRPRATSERTQSVQNASVSVAPTSGPMISRRPVSCTPWAMTTHVRCTRPPSRTFLHLGIEEQIEVAALQRPRAKRLHLLVEPRADP